MILIGDHHQLPPVVKNMAFQKYSHLDQSLFTRFIRLGTPYIQLNAQVCLFCILPFVCMRVTPACSCQPLTMPNTIFSVCSSFLLDTQALVEIETDLS